MIHRPYSLLYHTGEYIITQCPQISSRHHLSPRLYSSNIDIAILYQESQLLIESIWRRDSLYGWICFVHICDDEKTGKPANLGTLVDIRGIIIVLNIEEFGSYTYERSYAVNKCSSSSLDIRSLYSTLYKSDFALIEVPSSNHFIMGIKSALSIH